MIHSLSLAWLPLSVLHHDLPARAFFKQISSFDDNLNPFIHISSYLQLFSHRSPTGTPPSLLALVHMTHVEYVLLIRKTSSKGPFLCFLRPTRKPIFEPAKGRIRGARQKTSPMDLGDRLQAHLNSKAPRPFRFSKEKFPHDLTPCQQHCCISYAAFGPPLQKEIATSNFVPCRQTFPRRLFLLTLLPDELVRQWVLELFAFGGAMARLDDFAKAPSSHRTNDNSGIRCIQGSCSSLCD